MNHAFTVTGMTCGHCEMAVRQALLALDPAAQVQIDRASNRVQVFSVEPRQALALAIEDEGFVVVEQAAGA